MVVVDYLVVEEVFYFLWCFGFFEIVFMGMDVYCEIVDFYGDEVVLYWVCYVDCDIGVVGK